MHHTSLTFVFILTSVVLFSQNIQYLRLGQNFKGSNETTCLLIKNDPKTLQKLALLDNYKSVNAVKLTDFDDLSIGFDSLFYLLSKHLNPQLIIFENCALNRATEALPSFAGLTELRILKNTVFNDNLLTRV